ncbi:MAG TPA: PspC domain-containing protein, partial [Rhodothermales bacterium]|nr:PspC domain-containing protein [Rhodothermales bacterium]
DGRKVMAGEKRKLMKSRDNKKVAGVAAGIAEYFNWDPTVVRVAFVVGAFVTQGAAVALYLILAAVLPKTEPMSLEERLRVIRDS